MTTYIHYFTNPAEPVGTVDDPFTVASASPEYLAERLGISPSFWKDLVALESDWAFTVQLHALLEAAFTDALVTAKRLRRKRDERMSIGEKREQLASLRRLTPTANDFVIVFSRMRNHLVHDIRKVYASLRDEFSDLSADDVRKLIDLSAARRPLPQYAIDDARNWPREMLMYGCMNVLAEITR